MHFHFQSIQIATIYWNTWKLYCSHSGQELISFFKKEFTSWHLTHLPWDLLKRNGTIKILQQVRHISFSWRTIPTRRVGIQLKSLTKHHVSLTEYNSNSDCLKHDDVIKWKHFPRYWPFVRGIHRSLVNSPHKGQWRGALMFSLICVWINDWINNREAGDLRRYRAHYDVIVMVYNSKSTKPLPGSWIAYCGVDT